MTKAYASINRFGALWN